ncbi:MAG: right-handed parallel beta-helix repeat-containing protein [Clostridia bacterium]|nr:right-handed parallel beta-helix repeat-containing protein [Clostridia bacterium]
MINCSNISSIYVSQEYGNDNHTGFFPDVNSNNQGPLKTIECALKKTAELRRIGARQPISIVLTDDIYFVSKPIVITNDVCSVTIRSNRDTSTICGGFKIKGFKEDVFNGHKCFSAEVPEVKNNNVWFTDLYVDGKRADFTSFPKNGFLTPESVENTSSELFASSKWFVAKKCDMEIFKDFKNFNDCFISYNHYWIDEHTPIKSCDIDSGKITFKYPSRFTIELTHPASAPEYKIENTAEMFENKNEWYLDRETSKVYYIPRNNDQTPENIEVFAPLAEKLFVIKGTKEKSAENITLSNLKLFCTKGDYSSIYERIDSDNNYIVIESGDGYASDPQSLCFAHGSVEFYYAKNCSVEDCTLSCLGVHAVTINNGCSGIRIYHNVMKDMGAGGIKINGGEYGCEKCEETHNNTISQNLITNCGNRYFAACGILIMHSYENTVSNNEISYLYYTGISVGWVWGYNESITHNNRIEYNYIHHIGQGKLSDMGGIYLLGKQPGTVVRNNIIHDVISRHYGGWGLYTDEGSSYILLENNICYNVTNNCYHQHYGCMNTVRNNIFVKSGANPVRQTRDELHTGSVLEKNIIVSDKEISYTVGDTESSGALYVLQGHENLHYNVNGETYITQTGDKKYTLDEYKSTFGGEDGSVIADPMFKDYENNDFTLCEESPAYKLGFRKIDTSNVGITIK